MPSSKLPRHNSQNYNGPLRSWAPIPLLTSEDFVVHDDKLSGDAPKRLISLYEPDEVRGIDRSDPQTWPKYIAKSAEKWHPIEGVTEFLINRIDAELNLSMNEVKLRRYEGGIWFLSKYFLNEDGSGALMHGVEICGEFLQDHTRAKEVAENIKAAKDLFNFEFISRAIQRVFPHTALAITTDLVATLGFDCLVGNNDRHFSNWAVMYNVKDHKALRFSPVYDSARGLFWNLPDGKLLQGINNKRSEEAFLMAYAMGSKPRVSGAGLKQGDHFSLVRHLTRLDPLYRATLAELASESNEGKAVATVEHEFRPLLTDLRIDLITKLLRLRFTKTREATR